MSRSVFKNRPKVFSGTPAWKKAQSSAPAEDSTTATQTPAEMPIPLPTASHKKLAISGNLPSTSNSCEPYEYTCRQASWDSAHRL